MLQGKDTTSDTLARAAKTGATAFSAIALVKTIVVAVIITAVMIFLMVNGLPWYIGTIFIVFVIIGVILQIIKLKRISSVEL